MTSKEIFDIIKSAKNVAIFAHQHPDPDAYGSMFAVRDMCKNLGINAEIFAVKSPKCYLDEMFPLDDVKDNFSPKKFDLAIVVDASTPHRVEKKFEQINEMKKIVVIDHHLPDSRGDITENSLVDVNMAACCQLLTHFFVENKVEITKDIATYLWAGITGDTGRFLHSNIRKDTFDVASLLFEKGADVQKIYDLMYRRATVKQIKLRNTFTDKMTLLNGGKVGFVIFSNKDKAKLGVTDEDLKPYINEIIQIEGVELSLVCYEFAENYYKVSLRSKNFNAQKFAEQHNGGGHICAAGFELNTTKGKLKKLIKEWVKDIK